MRFLWVGLFIISVCSTRVEAQKLNNFLFSNPGLQFGMYHGRTAYTDGDFNYYFRLYNQHIFDDHRFGEISLSSGVISGIGYRNQLTPIEYRFGYRLSNLGIPKPNLFGRSGSFYSYAGLGLLYNRPLEIVAPNDPLTVEMGEGLPTTSFWDFDGGLVPFIPFGVGFDLPLDLNTKLNISVGYNQSLSFLKLSKTEMPKGYWGISIGINFKTPTPVKKSDILILPPLKTFREVPIEDKKLKPVDVPAVDMNEAILDKINSRNINFEILSSELDEDERKWVEEISFMLKMTPDFKLEVFGHADSIGTTKVNEMISQSRARAVWLDLVSYGVDPVRLNYNWYADNRPITSNRSRDGRLKNRRVEFRTLKTDHGPEQLNKESIAVEVPEIFADFKYNRPLFKYYEIFFSEEMLKLDRFSKSLINQLGILMKLKPEMNLLVWMYVDEQAGQDLRVSLSKARVDLLKAELLKQGISIERVINIAEDQDLRGEYEYLIDKPFQQNYIIPVSSVNTDQIEGEK